MSTRTRTPSSVKAASYKVDASECSKSCFVCAAAASCLLKGLVDQNAARMHLPGDDSNSCSHVESGFLRWVGWRLVVPLKALFV